MSLYAGVLGLTPQKRLDAAQEMALVERCRRHGYDAFSEIVDAYQGRVYGFVKGLVRSSEDALDVTQEVFIRAFQAFDRFDGRSSLRTWLFRIAHNLCIDRARKISRTGLDVSIDAPQDNGDTWDFPDQRSTPEGSVLDDELLAKLQEGIESMSEKLRTVLFMHDQEEMSYEEIAAALNIPMGTVKSRLFLARNYLQGYLAEYMKG